MRPRSGTNLINHRSTREVLTFDASINSLVIKFSSSQLTELIKIPVEARERAPSDQGAITLPGLAARSRAHK